MTQLIMTSVPRLRLLGAENVDAYEWRSIQLHMEMWKRDCEVIESCFVSESCCCISPSHSKAFCVQSQNCLQALSIDSIWPSCVMSPGNALFVTAHPDDEVMFFGPTIQRLLLQGAAVHVLCLSTGLGS